MAGMTPLVPMKKTGPHTGRAAPTQTFLAKNVTEVQICFVNFKKIGKT
jgi:hypothetical protein